MKNMWNSSLEFVLESKRFLQAMLTLTYTYILFSSWINSRTGFTNTKLNTWIPYKVVIPLCFISWKTNFLIKARSAFYQIWLGGLTALIIFGKIHFLLISENEFFHEMKCDRTTVCMEFMSTIFWKEDEWIQTYVKGITGFLRPKLMVLMKPSIDMKRNWPNVTMLPLPGNSL